MSEQKSFDQLILQPPSILTKKGAIGIIDTGVGGLTVMKQIMNALPNESLIYFGDTARVPYGGKSRETIIRYSIENVIFMMQKNIKMLVIACNTISAYALEKLKQIFNIPIIGVISPGAKRAAQVTTKERITVIGTKATINSGEYTREIQSLLPTSTVFSIPCPLFVPLVEEQFFSHQATRLIIREYLQPLKQQKVDTLLLGCTHYPLIQHIIREEVDQEITIIDSATTCAEEVAATLNNLSLQSDNNRPQYMYYVSDDPLKFRMTGKTFLGNDIHKVEAISSYY